MLEGHYASYFSTQNLIASINDELADLATDPVFSPDILKSEHNRSFEKDKNPTRT